MNTLLPRRRPGRARALAVVLLAGAMVACAGKAPRTAAPAPVPGAAGGSTPVGATAPATDIELYPATLLAQVADELARVSSTGRTLGTHPSYRYIQGRRGVTGSPEVHDGWIDITVIQAGGATLITGGRLEGSRLLSAGEHSGGTIVGGTSRRVAPGDLFVVPAGVPHFYQLAPGDSLRYLTIKVLQPPAGG
jgi:hypothetical protein